MAGSYGHITNEDGSWIGDEFTDMIENLGDAWEMGEEMYKMIQFLAKGDKSLIDQARSAIYSKEYVEAIKPPLSESEKFFRHLNNGEVRLIPWLSDGGQGFTFTITEREGKK